MSNLDHFSKKIQPYLDGALKADELTEFEAYASTHKALMDLINSRKKQLDALKNHIPEPKADEQTHDQLTNDLEEAVKNLFKPDLNTITAKINHWWNEFI